MPIIEMTRGHIDFMHGERSVRIEGELLVPEGSRQHYVVYASSITSWLPPHSTKPLTAKDREEILASLLRELPSDKMVLEVDSGGVQTLPHDPAPQKALGNDICPSSGFWSSSAKQNSRRYFFQGERMPVLRSDYGVTLWYWDGDQSTPEHR